MRSSERFFLSDKGFHGFTIRYYRAFALSGGLLAYRLGKLADGA